MRSALCAQVASSKFFDDQSVDKKFFACSLGFFIRRRVVATKRHLRSSIASDTLNDLAGRPKFVLWIQSGISRFDWLKARRVAKSAQFGLHTGSQFAI